MTIFATVAALILLCYGALAAWMGARLLIGRGSQKKNNDAAFSISQLTVLIPCRNEAAVIQRLFDQLKRSGAHVVVINDHSTDNTAEIARLAGATVIQNSGRGKKDALRTGLAVVQTPFVLTLDADVILPTNQLAHLQLLINQVNADLWLFPVLTKSAPSALARFEALDVLSLNATAAAFAYQNHAIMGSGACLLIRTEVYREAIAHLRYELASGDDVFLIQHLRIAGKRIHMFTQAEAQVEVEAHTSLRAFIRQRIRWGQKSPAYSDPIAQGVAWLVMFANFSVLLSLIGLVSTHNVLFLAPIAAKIIFDLALLLPAAIVFKRQQTLRFLLPAVLFYPFYLSFAAGWAVLTHPAVRRKANKNWDSPRRSTNKS